MTESLSENWRRGHSTIPEVEMANALNSLRKLVGALTEDPTINVGYTANTQSYYAESGVGDNVTSRQLNISAQPIKEIPIPAGMFDVLCGYTSHESSHHTNESVKDKLFGAHPDNTRLGIIETIGEEIYCDSFPPGGDIAKRYIRIARDYHVQNDPPITDWTDLWRTWSAISIYNRVPDEWNPSIAKNLGVLLSLTKTLRSKELTPHSRAMAYKNTLDGLIFLDEKIENKPGWGKRKRAVLDPDLIGVPVDPQFGRENRITVEEYDKAEKKAKEEEEARARAVAEAGKSEEEKEDEEGCLGGLPYEGEPNYSAPCMNNQYSIDPKVAKTIQKHLENSTSDITDQIMELLAGDGDGDRGGNKEMVPVLLSNADTPIVSGFPDKTIQELEWLRNLRLSLGHQTDRALERGQLDQSRLHMADVDGKVFKMKKPLPRKEQEIVLLIDASGSMRKSTTPYGSANPLYDEVNAVWKVLGVPIYTYTDGSTEQDAKCIRIQRLDRDGKIRLVETGSGTPSGAGLIGIALKHPRATIIHFTDGEPNAHIAPEYAMKAIAEHFPDIYVINIVHKEQGRIGESPYANTLTNNTLVELQSLDNFGRTLQSQLQRILQMA